MVISRCLILSYLFAREFQLSQVEFLWSIFRRPGLLIAASASGLWLCRNFVAPGRTWFQLISIGVLFALLYAALAFRFVIAPEHQDYVLERLRYPFERFRARLAGQARSNAT
jgi:hypothetical protein